MLTQEDIKTLITAEREVFAVKDDLKSLANKADVEILRAEFHGLHGEMRAVSEGMDTLTGAVDAFMKKADTYYQEMAVLMHKVHRMEEWIRQVAAKVGIQYG